MESILSNLRDASWWFTAVLIGTLASIAAGFLKDYLERRYGLFLKWSASRRELARAERAKAIDEWSNSEGLVMVVLLKTTYTLLIFTASSLLVALYITYIRPLLSGENYSKINCLGSCSTGIL